MPDRDDKFLDCMGNPLSPGGALYHFTDIRGAADLQVEMVRVRLIGRGIPITPEIEASLHALRDRLRAKLIGGLRQLGVPAYLRELLASTSKRDVQKLARKMRVNKADLSALFFNADQIGFTHSLIKRQFVPDQLKHTDEEWPAFRREPNSKLGTRWFRKMKATFQERRCVVVHMLDQGPDWHCFYFSYTDAFADHGHTPHWKGGTHVHFVNHLWGTPQRDEVLGLIETRRSPLPSVHIAFDEDAG